MELSNKAKYALLALLELANHYDSGEPLQIRQISILQDIPNRYLEQLLATLRRGGLIKGLHGTKGGYVLAREPKKITLLDALRCIEGAEPTMGVSRTALKTIDSEVVEETWKVACQAANSVWQKYTLQDLCEQLAAQRQAENMYYI